MATAKQIINSIKPNVTKVPTGKTQLGSAGYDNVRDDIEKVKKLREGSIEKVPVNNSDIANKKYVDDEIDADILTHKGDANAHHAEVHTHTHASTTGQTADDHHAQSHSVASHSDTSATGTELNTLTDNSIANTLHRHSELVASDGSPDPALSVNANGRVGIGTTSPVGLLHLYDSNPYLRFTHSGDSSTAFIQKIAAADGGFRIYDGTAYSVYFNNGKVGIGTTAPATSAKLELSSTTGALLLTRMTTAQRNALTAVNGMILYNTTLNKVQVYEGGAWASVI